jgi:hypothetical protein
MAERLDMARITILYKIKHDLVDVTLRNARTSRGKPQQLSQLNVRNM